MRPIRAAIVLLVILVVSAPFAQAAEVDARTSALDSVAALNKPVTLTMRAASLKDILSKIQSATGYRIWASRDVGEDKATIRVKDKPAREVLRELARCFDLGWSEKQGSDGPYLYLWMDKRSLEGMSQRQGDDYWAIVKQFDDELRQTARLVASNTEFKLEEQNTANLVQDDVDKLWLRGLATHSTDMGAAVLQYMKLSDAQRNDLLSGKHVVVSGSAISSDAMQKWPEAKSLDFWVDASLGGYLLKCRRTPETDDGNGSLLANAVFDDTRYDKKIAAANEALAKDPALSKALAAPKAEKPAASTPPAPTTFTVTSDIPDKVVFASRTQVQNPGEGTAATPATMSDGLLALAEELDLSLVAQFVSEYKGYVEKDGKLGPAPSTAKTASERLAELSLLHKFTVENDGDYLLAKSMVWHRLRPREIPEAKIRKWQAEITGLNAPTLGVALEIGSLSWAQLRGAINNQTPWFGAGGLFQLASCEYGLKLYASMSPEMRRILDSGKPISCTMMNDAQRHLFMQGFEMREQPTYEQATDPRWIEKASFSIKDNVGDYDMIAVSGMRQLGYTDLLTDIESARKSNAIYAEMTEDALIQMVLPVVAKKLLNALVIRYPDIKPNKTSLYTTRNLNFSFNLGSNSRQTNLSYSVKCQ